jgi:hypothetical protein
MCESGNKRVVAIVFIVLLVGVILILQEHPGLVFAQKIMVYNVTGNFKYATGNMTVNIPIHSGANSQIKNSTELLVKVVPHLAGNTTAESKYITKYHWWQNNTGSKFS